MFTEEEINDFRLFDGQSVKVDFFKRFDLAIFDKSAKLGYWLPVINALLTQIYSTKLFLFTFVQLTVVFLFFKLIIFILGD